MDEILNKYLNLVKADWLHIFEHIFSMVWRSFIALEVRQHRKKNTSTEKLDDAQKV